MKKILYIILSVLFVLPLVVGCSQSGKKANENTSSDPGNVSPDTFEILPDSLSKYTITRAADCGGIVLNSVNQLKNAINSAYGVELATGDDFYREGYNTIPEYEILVGSTDRDESKEFLSDLKYDDYGYGIVGKKLVIAGHKTETTAKAVEHFVSNVLEKRSDNVFFSDKNKFVYHGEYAVDSVRLNGVQVSKYTIVYPYRNKNYEKAFAEKLRDKMLDLSGYYLNIEPDNEISGEGYEIIIGESSHLTDPLKQNASSLTNDKYLVTSNEKLVWITASDVSGMHEAIDELIIRLTPAESAKSSDLIVGNGFSHEFTKETLSVMSYNVYVGDASARKDKVISMIRNYMPDTFGLQEASPTWVNYISEAFPDYAYVGEFRSGEGSEKTPVFYKKDKFELIETGTKWLSDTPDIEGSKYEGSGYARIMTYAILEEKKSGQRFIHVNTHLDHLLSEIRAKQSKVLIELIEDLPDYPVILTGDFNAKSDSDAYKTVTSAFFNSSSKVDASFNVPTFHGFDGRATIIDFVFFIRTHAVVIDSYKVCDEMINGSFASDHHPVYTEYIIIH